MDRRELFKILGSGLFLAWCAERDGPPKQPVWPQWVDSIDQFIVGDVPIGNAVFVTDADGGGIWRLDDDGWTRV